MKNHRRGSLSPAQRALREELEQLEDVKVRA